MLTFHISISKLSQLLIRHLLLMRGRSLEHTGRLTTVLARCHHTDPLECCLAEKATRPPTVARLRSEACILYIVKVALASLATRAIAGRLTPVEAVALMLLHFAHEDGAALGVERC